MLSAFYVTLVGTQLPVPAPTEVCRPGPRVINYSSYWVSIHSRMDRAQILEYSLILVSAVSLGHVSTEALAASSLSSITATVTGLSLVHGFASALDSLLPQAWTSEHPENVGLWTQRMVVVMSINTIVRWVFASSYVTYIK
jgi:hypothetical protein